LSPAVAPVGLLAVPGSPVGVLSVVGGDPVRIVGGVSTSTIVPVAVGELAGSVPAPVSPRSSGHVSSPSLAVVAPWLVEVSGPLVSVNIGVVAPGGVPVSPLVVVPLLVSGPSDVTWVSPVESVVKIVLGLVQGLVSVSSLSGLEVVLQESPLGLGELVLGTDQVSVRGVLGIAVVLLVVPGP